MSNASSKKKTERLRLARKIESCGLEMIPCSRCRKQNRKCVVDKESSARCAECVRSKCSCDVKSDSWETNVPSVGDWESIAKQKERLEEQEEEAMAKILRLRKQRKLLLRREAEMAKRGLQFLDELDAVEEKERKEKEEAEQRAAVASNSPADPSGDLLDDPLAFSGVAFGGDLPLSPSFWESLDYVGGTAPGDPHS